MTINSDLTQNIEDLRKSAKMTTSFFIRFLLEIQDGKHV
ncbi:hypothetical protein S101359_03537 [Bacillus atrophaeus]|nr:hypothetical protein S101359_03537 [Bacillus atrophaeus]